MWLFWPNTLIHDKKVHNISVCTTEYIRNSAIWSHKGLEVISLVCLPCSFLSKDLPLLAQSVLASRMKDWYPCQCFKAEFQGLQGNTVHVLSILADDFTRTTAGTEIRDWINSDYTGDILQAGCLPALLSNSVFLRNPLWKTICNFSTHACFSRGSWHNTRTQSPWE